MTLREQWLQMIAPIMEDGPKVILERQKHRKRVHDRAKPLTSAQINAEYQARMLHESDGKRRRIDVD